MSDLTVIDFTWHVAGPYTSKLFADYGARVIKVERPALGDPARTTGPFFRDNPHFEKSALFLHLNRGKQSITLNLKTGDGRAIARELVKHADLVIENFRPGVMESLGLGFSDIARLNGRTVLVSISNFGQWGPYRDYKASELNLFAMSGAMIGEGDRQREPLKFGGYQALYFGGGAGASGAMIALHSARMTGDGQHVDVSIFESVVELAAMEMERWIYSGDLPESEVARRPYYYTAGAFPLGVYHCKDGLVCMIGSGVRYYRRFADMMGHPELMDDPRFNSLEGMRAHSDEFLVYLLEWLSDKTVDQAVELAQSFKVPAAPLTTIDRLFTERQFKSREFFTTIDHPVVGPQTYTGAPFRFPLAPPQVSRAPLLGEHNRRVYSGLLGLSAGEVERLRQTGVI